MPDKPSLAYFIHLTEEMGKKLVSFITGNKVQSGEVSTDIHLTYLCQSLLMSYLGTSNGVAG